MEHVQSESFGRVFIYRLDNQAIGLYAILRRRYVIVFRKASQARLWVSIPHRGPLVQAPKKMQAFSEKLHKQGLFAHANQRRRALTREYHKKSTCQAVVSGIPILRKRRPLGKRRGESPSREPTATSLCLWEPNKKGVYLMVNTFFGDPERARTVDLQRDRLAL